MLWLTNAALLACSSPTNESAKTEARDTDNRRNAVRCDAAIEAIRTMNLKAWNGLPADCDLAQIKAAFPPSSSSTWNARLGGTSTEFVMVPVPNQEDPMRVWFDEGGVLLLDMKYPDIGITTDVLREALGAPAVALDFPFASGLQIEHGQLVWPDRGITLFLKPKNGKLVRVALFAPCSLEHYRSRLMLDLEIRESKTPDRLR